MFCVLLEFVGGFCGVGFDFLGWGCCLMFWCFVLWVCIGCCFTIGCCFGLRWLLVGLLCVTLLVGWFGGFVIYGIGRLVCFELV